MKANRKAESKPAKATAAGNRTIRPAQDAIADLKAIRTAYGLSPTTFARMLGLSKEAEARMEQGKGPTDIDIVARFGRVKGIVEKAAGAMRLAYVPTWVEKPSPACAEIGANAPTDLMERGEYDAVEGLLFFLGSGVPY